MKAQSKYSEVILFVGDGGKHIELKLFSSYLLATNFNLF